jgi:altronate dehydratase small subunit
MAIDAIVVNEADNVATALRELKAGDEATFRRERELGRTTLRDDIPYGHKFAIRPVRRGEDVLKYGEVIGRATKDIVAGGHAHVQNVESLRGRGDLRKAP